MVRKVIYNCCWSHCTSTTIKYSKIYSVVIVITRSIFTQILTKDTQSSPVRARCLLWIYHMMNILPQSLSYHTQNRVMSDRAITELNCNLLQVSNISSRFLTRITRSIPWLMMPWLLPSPGHHQLWHWIYRINGPLSSTTWYFKYTRAVSVFCHDGKCNNCMFLKLIRQDRG